MNELDALIATAEAIGQMVNLKISSFFDKSQYHSFSLLTIPCNSAIIIFDELNENGQCRKMTLLTMPKKTTRKHCRGDYVDCPKNLRYVIQSSKIF